MFQNPIVKLILTLAATLCTTSAAIPQLMPWSAILTPIGTGILGALHVPRPGDVKGDAAPEAKP